MNPGGSDPATDGDGLSRLATVVGEYPVRLAVLFGSQADGTATEESDVDVAVAFETDLSLAERLNERIDLTTELVRVLGTNVVDVTDLDSVPPGVGADALETGELLVGDRSTLVACRQRFERERTSVEGTHDERMQRFESILERLDAAV